MNAITVARLIGHDTAATGNGPMCSTCRKRMRLSSLKPNVSQPYRLPIASFQCDCGRGVSMHWRPEGRRFAVMAGAHDNLRREYAVFTVPNGGQQVRWRWEIKRLRKPLEEKFCGDGFFSANEAQQAGLMALIIFLERLVQELTSNDGSD